MGDFFFVKGQQWEECFLRSDNFMKRFLFSKLWNMKISLDKSSKFGDNGYFFHVLQCIYLSFFMIKSKKFLRDWKLWQKKIQQSFPFSIIFLKWRKLTFLKNMWFVVFFSHYIPLCNLKIPLHLIICRGLSINDVTHYLRFFFFTPPSSFSPILLNRLRG